LLGDTARKAREKREAKQRAKILRQVEMIEKLLDLLPPKQARDPVYRLLREVLRMIQGAQQRSGEHG
jgi:hypothetical protein